MLNYMVTCRNMDKKPYDNKLNSIVSAVPANISNTASSISGITDSRVVEKETLNSPQHIFMKALKPRTGDLELTNISSRYDTSSLSDKPDSLFGKLAGSDYNMSKNSNTQKNSIVASALQLNNITDTMGK